MKTPTKKPSSEMGTPPSTRGRIYKKYEVLVLSLADAHSQVEEVRGSPDVGVAYVGVPGAALTGSRLAQVRRALFSPLRSQRRDGLVTSSFSRQDRSSCRMLGDLTDCHLFCSMPTPRACSSWCSMPPRALRGCWSTRCSTRAGQ